MNILLAVDDDAASYEAALVVSEWFPSDASVVALHVGLIQPARAFATPFIASTYGHPVVHLPALRDERRKIYLEAREIAERAAALTDGEVRTESGDPAKVILDVAADIDADLIVIGTGDRSWLSRLLNPSVSEGVVQNATRPVLVVRPPGA